MLVHLLGHSKPVLCKSNAFGPIYEILKVGTVNIQNLNSTKKLFQEVQNHLVLTDLVIFTLI